MKRIVAVITSLALLAGCGANPATQAQLNANNAACAAGDPDACTAAQYTAQQAAAEAQQNTNALVTGLAPIGTTADNESNQLGGYPKDRRWMETISRWRCAHHCRSPRPR